MREEKLFWVHDLVLCTAECEPQPAAGQAGSVRTAFVQIPRESTDYVPSGVQVNELILLVLTWHRVVVVCIRNN